MVQGLRWQRAPRNKVFVAQNMQLQAMSGQIQGQACCYKTENLYGKWQLRIMFIEEYIWLRSNTTQTALMCFTTLNYSTVQLGLSAKQFFGIETFLTEAYGQMIVKKHISLGTL